MNTCSSLVSQDNYPKFPKGGHKVGTVKKMKIQDECRQGSDSLHIWETKLLPLYN